jgi:hypothetical protein
MMDIFFCFPGNQNIVRDLLMPTKQQNKGYNKKGGDYVISRIPARKLSDAEYQRISQMLQYRRRES